MFKEVHLSYFKVGHTHFGPDQIASRISCSARCNDIFDRLDNARVLAGAYTPRLEFEHLDDVANCQDCWFPGKSDKGERQYSKKSGSVTRRLYQITKVRHFLIKMGVAKKPAPGEPATRVVRVLRPLLLVLR